MDESADHGTLDPVAASHPLIHEAAPELIATQGELDALCGDLGECGRFAYDTEFIGETSYRPKLCLVQIATADRLAIVDPIGPGGDGESGPGLDLAPMWRLLADPRVEKVVHAGQPDLEPVVRWLNEPPRAIFDTQIASGLIETDYPAGLRTLLTRHVGLTLPKALTFTAWDARPLSGAHLRYAADDVRYLLALREAVGRAVEARGRSGWAAEEFSGLCETARYRFDVKQLIHRIRRSHRPPRKHDVLLRKLVVWRERLAASQDLPPRAVLRDRVLAELARQAPATLGELGEVADLPRRLVAEQGERLTGLVAEARAHPRWGVAKEDRPLSRRQEARVGAWWSMVKERCEAASVSLGLVVSRANFEKVAKRAVRGRPWGEDAPMLYGWRAELLAPVFEAMRGQGGDRD